MRVGPAFNDFNSGEYGERMDARVDFAKYASAGARFLNILPLPQGPWTRRPGSRYIAGVADSSSFHRIIAFQFSTIRAYVLEFGNATLRFYRLQASVSVENTDASITNGTFDSNVTGWSDQSTGGTAVISHDSTLNMMNLVGDASQTAVAQQEVAIGASFRSTVHVLTFRIYGAPGDIVKVRIGSTSGATDIVNDFQAGAGYHSLDFDPATNSSVFIQFRNEDDKTKKVDNVALLDNEPLEIATPYATADLPFLKYAQSPDVLYLCRGSDTASETAPVYRLERFGDLRWSLEEVLFTDGPYLDENTTTTTMTPGAANGFAVTVTASSVTGINDNTGFQTTDIGRLIRIYNGTASKWAWGVIVSRSSTTVVGVDHKGSVDFQTAAKTEWKLGEFSGTTGHPRVVAFVQQRMFLAATSDEPQKFYMSQSGAIEDFTEDDLNNTVENDDAFSFRMAAEEVNTIIWASYRRRLALGTVGGEWTVESEGQRLLPSDIDAVPQTSFGGSETVSALKARNRQLYVQRTDRKLLEYGYSFNDDAYQSLDLTILSDRILKTGVTEMAYAQEPDSIVWCVRSDGVLAALTYQPEQEVLGWSRHILGGSFGEGDAVVESVATIPGTNGAGQIKDSTGRTEVWLVVKRTIDGNTTRYVEVFEKIFNGDEDDQEDAYYFDSIVTYDSTSTTTITGLDHLEGEVVKVWADGALQTDKTVASGQITLDRAASVAQVGLGYRHKWKALQLAYGAQAGSATGKNKVPQKVGFNLLETAENSLFFGTDESPTKPVELRTISDATTLPAPLFTGQTKMLPIAAAWGPDTRIYVEGDHGPCTVRGMPFDLAIQERM